MVSRYLVVSSQLISYLYAKFCNLVYRQLTCLWHWNYPRTLVPRVRIRIAVHNHTSTSTFRFNIQIHNYNNERTTTPICISQKPIFTPRYPSPPPCASEEQTRRTVHTLRNHRRNSTMIPPPNGRPTTCKSPTQQKPSVHGTCCSHVGISTISMKTKRFC